MHRFGYQARDIDPAQLFFQEGGNGNFVSRIEYGRGIAAALRAAGADKAKLLILALDSPEKNRELVATVEKQFPQLTILARAPGRSPSRSRCASRGTGRCRR